MFLKSMLACAVLLTPLAVRAADQDFKIVNRTGYQIDSVFLSTPDDNKWGSDVMGQDALADGEGANINFSKGTQACKWDLKVTCHDDNSTAVWHGLDLCSISTVSLHWNNKTQETTAQAE